MILIHIFDDIVYAYVYVVFVVDDDDNVIIDVAVDQAERGPLQQVVCIVPFDGAPEHLL